MPAATATRTIRGSLILVVMLTTVSALAVALGINQYFDFQAQRKKELTQATTLAALTAAHAESTIIENNANSATRQLTSFSVVSSLQSAQIYLQDNYTQQLKFFAGYTRSGVIPNVLEAAEVVALQTPRITDDFIELTNKITFKGEPLGYSYLKISLAELNQRYRNSIYQALSIVLAASLFALAITLRLQRRFSKPIDILVDVVQQVDLAKDYQIRAPELPLQELNFLGQAFNRMLSRIARRLHQQQQAEQEIRQLNQNLEEKVAERTKALKQTNSELLQTLEKLHLYQGQMLEKEKLHKLGEMVAGISHELNTPLGLGITTTTTVQQSLRSLKGSMKQGELSQRQLDQFLDQLDEACNILTRNLQRGSELIESFKHVAVDQCSEQDRTFELEQFINEVLLTLKPTLKKNRHIIHVFCDANIVISSKPGALSQILINLILNSIQHGFKHIEQGNITIKASIDNQQLRLIYEDDGCGMSEEVKNEVFTPYFTTAKNSGGSGLGMYIVQNLVQQVLGGELQLQTAPGQGISITITVPLEIKEA